MIGLEGMTGGNFGMDGIRIASLRDAWNIWDTPLPYGHHRRHPDPYGHP